MDIHHLRSFVAVAEELHFHRAAERLHVTQPSLSQHVRQLEKDLKTTLLVRTTRRVELTAAGRELLARARLILAAIDDAVHATEQAALGKLGRLTVGFTGTTTYELLPTLAKMFRADSPRVELVLLGEMVTPVQVDALLAGSMDVGFLRPPVDEPELCLDVVRREPMGVVLPERHPLAARASVRPADLADEPFVCHPSRSSVHTTVLRTCLEAGFEPRIVQESAQTSVVMSLVAAELGVALLPESVRHVHVTGTVFRPLRDTTAHMELAMAWRRAHEDTPLVQRFLRVARAVLPPSVQVETD
ncbi:LysR family transcriptional regulator [Amycolatopsis thermoflava]|uniref:LysR family transcriptional regulator n=1 Tax=Amycolatopsis TaxID=1813 RepID=UPI0033B9D943